MNEIRQITLKYISFMELNRIVCRLSLTLKILKMTAFSSNLENCNRSIQRDAQKLNLNFLM